MSLATRTRTRRIRIPNRRQPPSTQKRWLLAAVLWERSKRFPHERGASCGFDLLVFQEGELGCFTPLSGVFPSMFVQAVRVAVDLEQHLMLGGLLEGEGSQNQRKKNPKPIYKAEKKNLNRTNPPY